MSKKRKTSISIETHRVIWLRQQLRFTLWCPTCAAEVAMVTPLQAAVMAGVSSRTIYRWVEEAKLHFIEDLGGSLLVCADSLPGRSRKISAGSETA